jgi:hypothetical protein
MKTLFAILVSLWLVIALWALADAGQLHSAATPTIQSFTCAMNSPQKTVVWVNNTGAAVYVVDGYVWIGEGMGGRSDTAFTVGISDGSIVLQSNWDHYAEPHGAQDNIAPFDVKGYFTIPPSGALWLTLACTGPYGSDAPSIAGSMVAGFSLFHYTTVEPDSAPVPPKLRRKVKKK